MADVSVAGCVSGITFGSSIESAAGQRKRRLQWEGMRG
eukprot:CAMPEP_0172724058 /NCGR_PEP_ID=MMETSP1074-20121228/85094_1 /TAXON_ID=2916 /ORGANISM="Ceratium fusus, Strain PA161109" /LENGTH=37 /DNA_ID= /DNA_START= /DNA_END= /DNA_ORIENTATION=